MSNPIVAGEEYLALPSTPETWLIEPLLPSSGAMLIYGDPKIGKSFAALQLAEAIQAGTPWLGFPCRQGKVAYIQLDTPRNVWQTRIKELVHSHSMTNLPSFADRETLETHPFDILNPDHLVLLSNALDGKGFDLVIIDTIREAHSGDENDSTAMQKVIASLTAATRPAALVIVSHARKSGEESYSLMNDNRGSSYIVGRMDAIVRFTPKGARVSGRSIEEHSIDLDRYDSGFWEALHGEQDLHVAEVLANPSLTSIRAKAKELAKLSGKSEAAARGILRRRQAAHMLSRVKSTT